MLRIRASRRSRMFITIVALASLMASACASGGNNPSPAKNQGNVQIIVEIPNFGGGGPGDTGAPAVFAAANRMIKSKLGFTVNFQVIPGADYGTKISTILASGQPADLAFAANWLGGSGFTADAERGAFRPLNSLLDTYGSGIKEADPKYLLESSAIKGNIYGIATVQLNVLHPGWSLQKRVLAAAGLPTSVPGGILYPPNASAWTMATIPSVLAKASSNLKGTSPNFSILGYSAQGTGGIFDPMAYGYWAIDPSVHSKWPFYVKMGTTQVSMALPALQSYTRTMRQFYQAGYMPRDVGTNGNPPTLPPAAVGGSFNWSGGGDISAADSASRGQTPDEETLDLPLSPRPWFTGYNGGWSMPASGQHPKQAMQLLNMLFTNSKLTTLLAYGFEGKDYAIKNNTIVPTANSTYTVGGSCWIWGNCFVTPTWPYAAGSPADGPGFWKKMKQWNDSAIVSPLSGFTFDEQSVSAQWAQVQAASQHYQQELYTGSVDPTTVLPEYISALNAAGSSQVISAMQSQLNTYLKSHPQLKKQLLNETYSKLMSEPQARLAQ